MILKVERAVPQGTVKIPGSKSHTIRALFFAALASDGSIIRDPLISEDTLSAVRAVRALGSDVQLEEDSILVEKKGGVAHDREIRIDTGNSGTTFRLAMSAAALAENRTVITGDAQIRKRPMAALLEALKKLGAQTGYLEREGYAPLYIKGPLKGGCVRMPCVTSQFLTSLLIAAPHMAGDTTIIPTVLNERPYVDITTWWMDRLGIEYSRKGYERFDVKGGQSYEGFDMRIPGDHSSATFFLVLAAMTGGRLVLQNLYKDDPQGDKKVIDILGKMGAEITVSEDTVTIQGRELRGIDIDLNAMPDALPAFAVLGCQAEGTTRLMNVPQARLKETDRISVMCSELKKMGANIAETADGLVISKSRLGNARLSGHGDHRVVMALSLAGAVCDGTTTVDTAEAVDITFPNYTELMNGVGMDMELL